MNTSSGRPPILTPALAADGILVKNGRILLVRRANPPFRLCWAFPGGFVEIGETTEDAVVREVLEETGIRTAVKRLVGVYSDPGRDARGHVVSAAYLLTEKGGTLKGADDAKEARWWPIGRLPKLAFDHGRILKDALRPKGT
jgi:8-oxo-dGTP diphosphatase